MEHCCDAHTKEGVGTSQDWLGVSGLLGWEPGSALPSPEAVFPGIVRGLQGPSKGQGGHGHESRRSPPQGIPGLVRDQSQQRKEMLDCRQVLK